jgi:hypothetical protein
MRRNIERVFNIIWSGNSIAGWEIVVRLSYFDFIFKQVFCSGKEKQNIGFVTELYLRKKINTKGSYKTSS